MSAEETVKSVLDAVRRFLSSFGDSAEKEFSSKLSDWPAAWAKIRSWLIDLDLGRSGYREGLLSFTSTLEDFDDSDFKNSLDVHEEFWADVWLKIVAAKLDGVE